MDRAYLESMVPPMVSYRNPYKTFQPRRKFLPYPIYIAERIPMLMYEFFTRPFKPMDKRMMMVSSIYLLYTS
jgi:hypothetical protein